MKLWRAQKHHNKFNQCIGHAAWSKSLKLKLPKKRERDFWQLVLCVWSTGYLHRRNRDLPVMFIVIDSSRAMIAWNVVIIDYQRTNQRFSDSTGPIKIIPVIIGRE